MSSEKSRSDLGNTRRGSLTSTTDRVTIIKLVEEAVQNGARQHLACAELRITVRTLQRWKSPNTPAEDQRPVVDKSAPPNKLTPEERECIIETVNQPEFQSLPPSQIVPALAARGVYIASESTIYRVMTEYGEQHHRGRAAAPCSKPKSSHCVTGLRTCKYRPEYPAKGFATLESAREWVLAFVRWYRYNHHHSAIKFVTPHQLHSGKAMDILAKRHQVYELAKERNPLRWSKGTRNWDLPTEVWLNPEDDAKLANSSIREAARA